MTSASRERLIQLLEPVVEALGYELIDLEARPGGQHGFVRLYIDREAGIGLDDCEQVSRQVSGVLDVEDPIAGNYELEVSSPGFDRKLVKPAHFDRFAGCRVRGRLKRPQSGRRNFSGTLLRRDGERVTVLVDGAEMEFGIDDLDVVRLVPDFPAPGRN
jgi:ribosome maturation factor RimP